MSRVSGFLLAEKQPRDPQGWPGLFEIYKVTWSTETGCLEVLMADHVGEVRVAFLKPASFRSQDEGDMIDYWATRDSEGVGVASLYIIKESSYLAGLADTAVSAFNGELRHWLIAGNNQCVEVITDIEDEPFIEDTERYPEQ